MAGEGLWLMWLAFGDSGELFAVFGHVFAGDLGLFG